MLRDPSCHSAIHKAGRRKGEPNAWFNKQREMVRQFCDCGKQTLMMTSWTAMNPGRRFCRCAKYRVREIRVLCLYLFFILGLYELQPPNLVCKHNVLVKLGTRRLHILGLG